MTGDARRLLVEKWRKEADVAHQYRQKTRAAGENEAACAWDATMNALNQCADELEAALSPEAVPSAPAGLREAAQTVCDKAGGAMSYAMGRTWGEGEPYWPERFSDLNEAIGVLRAALQAEDTP